jgi:branched-chain amino acid transport system permease protein
MLAWRPGIGIRIERVFVETALQVLVSGLLTGVEYAVAAVGMTLIFSVGRVLNLAHGAFFALGAYIAYQSTLLGVPSVGGAVPAAIAGLVVGAAAERALVRPLRPEPVATATALLGVAVLAESGFSLGWGAADRSVPLRLPSFLVDHIVISAEQLIAVAAGVAVLGAIAVYVRTKPGLALTAAAADAEIAQLAGVDVGRLRTAVFGIGCAMAAAAGAFLSPLLSVGPTMGRVPLALTLAMVAAGGPGRIWGTVVASIIIGLASTFVGFYLAPPWSYVFALLLMTAVLLRYADRTVERMSL